MIRRENYISVIMPLYNSHKYIEESIKSVINQTIENWELIIINDCSTDNSIEIVNEYIKKDTRIRLINLKQNEGVANARNIGIENSKGQYIAFLDSDDIWLETKLEKQLDFMKQNLICFSCTDYEFISEEGKKLNKKISTKKISTYDDLLKYNTIGCLTVMIDMNKIESLSMPNIKHEDYITWLSITKKGIEAHGLQENLALYRKREKSISSNKIKSAKWTWDVLTKIERIPIYKACIYFMIYSLKNIRKHIF